MTQHRVNVGCCVLHSETKMTACKSKNYQTLVPTENIT